MIIVILLGVIVGGAIFGITRLRHGTPKPSDWAMSVPRSLMDDKTFVIVTKTRAEWERLGHKGLRYKNPESGEYTVADIIPCASCEEHIPAPPDMSKETMETYMCPKCGGRACP